MYYLIIALIVITSILLIGVVLIQKSKGGGLSSQFGGANQVMGVRRTNDFIEKTTWILASVVCVLAICSSFVMPRNITNVGSRVTPVATEQTQPANFNTDVVTPVATPADSAK